MTTSTIHSPPKIFIPWRRFFGRERNRSWSSGTVSHPDSRGKGKTFRIRQAESVVAKGTGYPNPRARSSAPHLAVALHDLEYFAARLDDFPEWSPVAFDRGRFRSRLGRRP